MTPEAYARKRAAIDELARAVSTWSVEDVEALARAVERGDVTGNIADELASLHDEIELLRARLNQ